jgi:hypothetical protein
MLWTFVLWGRKRLYKRRLAAARAWQVAVRRTRAERRRQALADSYQQSERDAAFQRLINLAQAER